MSIRFTVYGAPGAKGRPRFSSRNGFITTYTDKNTVMYENLVRYAYQQEYPKTILDGAINAEITAYFPIPQSASKKAKEAMSSGREWHTKKVDCDNLAKIVLDSLNGVAYRDDSQVSRLTVKKLYGDVPRVEILLTQLF